MADTTEADRHISNAIERLCDELRMGRIGTDKFNLTLDAITQLRASMNPIIVANEEFFNQS